MASRAYEFSIEDSKIDPSNSTIRQVSLISLGQAKGHETDDGQQLWVDGKSLDQIFDCLTEMGSLKLKLDHGGGVKTIAGWVDTFEKTGSKVLGALHFYDTEKERDKLFEIAKKNPDHLGLSLEFSGEDEVIGNKAFARCDEVTAVAAVDEAAANDSLFSQKSKDGVDKKDAKVHKVNMSTKKLDDAAQSAGDPIAEMSKKFGDFCKQYSDDRASLDERMKKFDDFITNSDGKGNIDGDGRNIDPNVTPVATNDDKSSEKVTNLGDDEKDEDMKDDDKKDDKVNKTDLEAMETRITKKLAASLGTKIPPAGVGAGITGGKTAKKEFQALVDEKTKELKGDKVKAMLECIKEFPQEYAEQRKKILTVGDKATRYL